MTGAISTALAGGPQGAAGYRERNNVWWSTSGVRIRWNGAQRTLDAYRSASGQGAASASFDPQLRSALPAAPDFALRTGLGRARHRRARSRRGRADAGVLGAAHAVLRRGAGAGRHGAARRQRRGGVLLAVGNGRGPGGGRHLTNHVSECTLTAMSSPAPTRKLSTADVRREALVAAAIRVFGERGYGARADHGDRAGGRHLAGLPVPALPDQGRPLHRGLPGHARAHAADVRRRGRPRTRRGHRPARRDGAGLPGAGQGAPRGAARAAARPGRGGRGAPHPRLDAADASPSSTRSSPASRRPSRRSCATGSPTAC